MAKSTNTLTRRRWPVPNVLSVVTFWLVANIGVILAILVVDDRASFAQIVWFSVRYTTSACGLLAALLVGVWLLHG